MTIYKLLLDSGERILPTLLEPRRISGISKLTGLSSITIRRNLTRMKETGAILQSGNDFSINEEYHDVRVLASILDEEELSKMIQNNNEQIVFRDAF